MDVPVASASLRKIIHIDMDAFYASVEQRDNPSLRGRPVAVGHGAARGVVAAASYEARAFGVRSALPSVTALRRCPDLVFVPPRFAEYRTVSRQIHAIFADYTPLIQPLALDEAYLDITAHNHLERLPTAWTTAKEIRARIFAETGLTASAGVSYNKFLAKLASGERKPNGQFAVTPEMGPGWVAGLPVARFHGVGPKTAARMEALGIQTGADLKAKSLEFLREHFGSHAEWYHDIARGEDHRPVEANRVRKSSSAETTFGQDFTLAADIEAGIREMADEVWAWCEKNQMFGRTVTVKIKFADFRQITRAKSRTGVVKNHETLVETALELVRQVFPVTRGVRLVGVGVSGFATGVEDAAPVDTAIPSDEDLPLFAALRGAENV